MTNSHLNLKVLICDPDFYGLHAISSYLAWDRRTRVVHLAPGVEEMFEWIASRAEAEWPDVIILDAARLDTPAALGELLRRLRAVIPEVKVLTLDHTPRAEYALAALEADAAGYFLRNDVGYHIAWAVVWAQEVRFAITSGVYRALLANAKQADWRLAQAAILPKQRAYPELTDRIRQAIQLCVVEGMSADLAADEMGVSPHTVRSYIKEGYRILEAADDSQYPADMSPQERAFMRFTALEETDSASDLPPTPTAHLPTGQE